MNNRTPNKTEVPTGEWKHPALEIIQERLKTHSFTQQSAKKIFLNALGWILYVLLRTIYGLIKTSMNNIDFDDLDNNFNELNVEDSNKFLTIFNKFIIYLLIKPFLNISNYFPNWFILSFNNIFFKYGETIGILLQILFAYNIFQSSCKLLLNPDDSHLDKSMKLTPMQKRLMGLTPRGTHIYGYANGNPDTNVNGNMNSNSLTEGITPPKYPKSSPRLMRSSPSPSPLTLRPGIMNKSYSPSTPTPSNLNSSLGSSSLSSITKSIVNSISKTSTNSTITKASTNSNSKMTINSTPKLNSTLSPSANSTLSSPVSSSSTPSYSNYSPSGRYLYNTLSERRRSTTPYKGK